MAIVTTTFSSAAGDAWASSTWASGDPSYKVDAQLQAWVSAINDSSKISIIHTPGNATARGANDIVYWLLRCRESDTSADYGLRFLTMNAGGAIVNSQAGAYSARSAGSSNNGSGTYTMITVLNDGTLAASLTGYALDYRIIYDAEGATPWFAVLSSTTVSGARVGNINLLMRLSTANMAAGSYYPSTGLGKWVYASSIGGGNYYYADQTLTFLTPQRSTAAPYIGVNAQRTLRYPKPATTYGDGYFFKLGAQYGDTHFLGECTYDILVSNVATGLYEDTVSLEGKTFVRAVGGLWLRTA